MNKQLILSVALATIAFQGFAMNSQDTNDCKAKCQKAFTESGNTLQTDIVWSSSLLSRNQPLQAAVYTANMKGFHTIFKDCIKQCNKQFDQE